MKPFNIAVAMVMCKQTEDQGSLMSWVKAIQTCNGESYVKKVSVVY